jgi:hypothetical protein
MPVKPRAVWLACALAGAGSAAASEPARRAVEDLRVLLVEALRSPTGRASGVITGRLSNALTSRFSTAAPLLIDVSTLRKYRQPGCARLNVKFSQAGVVEKKDAAPSDQVIAVQLNYCLDGRPPKSVE